MYYSIYFKLIYSSTSISIDLPEHIKINELRDYIKPRIEQTYRGVSNFNILPAGTTLREKAEPICLDEDVELFARFPKYFTAFYIAPVETRNIDVSECGICISNIDIYDMYALSCGHAFCRSCIDTCRRTGHYNCPFCRERTIA